MKSSVMLAKNEFELQVCMCACVCVCNAPGCAEQQIQHYRFAVDILWMRLSCRVFRMVTLSIVM
jgi:hypothetical protein